MSTNQKETANAVFKIIATISILAATISMCTNEEVDNAVQTTVSDTIVLTTNHYVIIAVIIFCIILLGLFFILFALGKFDIYVDAISIFLGVDPQKFRQEYENFANTDFKHNEKWAKWGYVKNQFNVGLFYSNGEGVTKDFTYAAFWYRKAAEQGHAGAQYCLGLCYYFGDGVIKDYEQAVNWYKKAATQGVPCAQFYLGQCYANGEGITIDTEQAEYWLSKAAKQGVLSIQDEKKYSAKADIYPRKDMVTPPKIDLVDPPKIPSLPDSIFIFLVICLVSIYFFILYGTDFIRSPWGSDGFKIIQCLPVFIFSFVLVVSIILKKEDGFKIIVLICILIGLILIQSVTTAFWADDTGFFALKFLLNTLIAIVINTICAILGIIIGLITIFIVYIRRKVRHSRKVATKKKTKNLSNN